MARTEIGSPVTGTVWKIERKVGDKVEEGDVIMIMESMKMEIPVVAVEDGIVKEISDVVMTKVKADNMDLVFDISGVSLNGVPTIMFARPDMDFTDSVVAQLNKPAPKAAASPAKKP